MYDVPHGKALWKFNKSLLLNKKYLRKIKEHILLTIKMLDNDDLRDEQVRREYLKYEIRDFTIRLGESTFYQPSFLNLSSSVFCLNLILR